jgi:hypothetical protein
MNNLPFVLCPLPFLARLLYYIPQNKDLFSKGVLHNSKLRNTRRT